MIKQSYLAEPQVGLSLFLLVLFLQLHQQTIVLDFIILFLFSKLYPTKAK